MKALSLLNDPLQIECCNTPNHSRVRVPSEVATLVDWYARQQGVSRPVASNHLMLYGLRAVLSQNPGAMGSLLKCLNAEDLVSSLPVARLKSPKVVSIKQLIGDSGFISTDGPDTTGVA